jgi:peptidoglycan/LPS O-acetylase OafA/YrhL
LNARAGKRRAGEAGSARADTDPGARFESLDGLRGIAALSVVLHHFIAAFAPWIFPDPALYRNLFADGPLVILANGAYAVQIFFVLSGFVISASAARAQIPLAARAIGRYLRLSVPLTVSLVLSLALLRLFPDARGELYRALPHEWLTYVYAEPTPGLADAIYEGLIGIYRWGITPFNNVAWSLRIELFGSLAIYALYRLSPAGWRVPLAALATVLCFAIAPYYIGFATGALLREAWLRGWLRNGAAAWAALAVGLVAGSLSPYPEAGGLFLPAAMAEQVMEFPVQVRLHAIGASFLLLAILSLAPLQAALAARGPRFLGHISFSLYLIHVPLIYTLIAQLFLSTELVGYGRFMLVLTALLASSLGAAWLLTELVDGPTNRLLARPERWSEAGQTLWRRARAIARH